MQKLYWISLAFFIAIQASAIQFSLPIRKNSHNAESLGRIVGAIRAGTHSKLSSDPLKPIKFFSPRIPGDYFTATISIGTPLQLFTVEVDTRAQFLCVINQSYPNPTKYEHKYKPKDSSTSVYDGLVFGMHFESGYMFGETYRDVFTIANYTYKNQSFGAISLISTDLAGQHPIGGVYPTDGVLGLGWSTNFTKDLVPEWDPPVDHINEVMDKHVFSVFMDRYVGGEVKTGKITFGAIDTENCGNFKFVPLREYNFYMIRSFLVDGFRIGDLYSRKYNGDIHAVYATGRAFTLIPYDDFYKVEVLLDPDYDFDTQLFTIPCKDIAKYPDLIWKIGGVDYAVPANNYIVDVGDKNGKCVMAVDAYSYGVHEDGLLLGDAFAQTYCAAFDVAGQQMGFASTKHGKHSVH